ncbi:hypothetical protein HOLleu_03763 [Holothuria leucospilota]|uniref:Uncharacterized protein n=1 Tax=Holothuria leucospilota TaxID=206669 RepID=A0A9Q1CT93_HOLLE|nr:hypothetical protein HOLleu_03763 [Holothuria leucospilota]
MDPFWMVSPILTLAAQKIVPVSTINSLVIVTTNAVLMPHVKKRMVNLNVTVMKDTRGTVKLAMHCILIVMMHSKLERDKMACTPYYRQDGLDHRLTYLVT